MKNNREKVGSKKYYGDIRLHLESAENYAQVDLFCQYLGTINNLTITSYGWSDKNGLVIFIYLEDPVPLGDMIGQIPMVEQVYKKKRKDITVELNNYSFETTPPVLTPSKEGVFV